MYLFNSALQEQHSKINLFVLYLLDEMFCDSEDVPSSDMSQIQFCVQVCEIPTSALLALGLKLFFFILHAEGTQQSINISHFIFV